MRCFVAVVVRSSPNRYRSTTGCARDGHGLGGSGACPTPRRSCLGCLALVPDVGRASEAGLDVGRDATDTDRDGGIHSRRSGRRAYSWSRKRRVGA